VTIAFAAGLPVGTLYWLLHVPAPAPIPGDKGRIQGGRIVLDER